MVTWPLCLERPKFFGIWGEGVAEDKIIQGIHHDGLAQNNESGGFKEPSDSRLFRRSVFPDRWYVGGEEKEAMKLTPSSWKDRGVICVMLGG